jgi:hypothetical protein
MDKDTELALSTERKEKTDVQTLALAVVGAVAVAGITLIVVNAILSTSESETKG